MPDTRSKNTTGDYNLFIKSQRKWAAYDMYENSSSGAPVDPKWAGNGLNPGNMPSRALSHNPVAIESSLFGIGSTNLVEPQSPITPQIKRMDTQNMFVREPVYVPAPLLISKSARPSQWTA